VLVIAAVIGLAASGGAKAVLPVTHGHAGTVSALAAGPAAPSPAGGNAALGASIAAGYGWGSGSQWTCLDNLWTRESGWSNTADTRVTHAGGDGPGSPVFAYGIAQARPAGKYPQAGQPPDLGGQASPSAQIKWGLSYISQDYGTPCDAWGHETSAGWY
jgi:hypothetical protein